MGLFKDPEVAGAWGALDDAAFTDGAPVSSHIFRELIRNGNRAISRGDLMFRWVGRADDDGGEPRPGAGASHVPPYWQSLLPIPAYPVPKMAGLTEMRVRLRADVTSGADVEVAITTNAVPTLDSNTPVISITGDGTLKAETNNSVRVQHGAGEILGFHVRALVDPDSDAAMVTATYGGLNTGTVDNHTQFSFKDVGTTWNFAPANPATGGHYVYFTDTTNQAIRHGPAEIVGVGANNGGSTDELFFWPPLADAQFLTGTTYFIKKLPSMHLASVACYSVERTP